MTNTQCPPRIRRPTCLLAVLLKLMLPSYPCTPVAVLFHCKVDLGFGKERQIPIGTPRTARKRETMLERNDSSNRRDHINQPKKGFPKGYRTSQAPLPLHHMSSRHVLPAKTAIPPSNRPFPPLNAQLLRPENVTFCRWTVPVTPESQSLCFDGMCRRKCIAIVIARR